MAASALVACVLLAAAPATVVDPYDALRDAVNAAYAADDHDALAAAAARALPFRPGYPTLNYLLAYAHAAAGRPDEALDALLALSARGVLPPHVENHADVFAPMHALPAAAALHARLARLAEPRGVARRVPVPHTAGAVVEGVAVATDGTLYLGSVRNGGVAVRRVDGSSAHWDAPAGSTMGLHLDATGRRLWVAVAPLAQYAGAPEPSTGLVVLDARTGERLAWHPLVADGAHAFGDFVLLADGGVVATDSLGGGAYALDAGGHWRAIGALAALRSPQGIVELDDHSLVIADYARGLYRYSPAAGLSRIADGAGVPYGIDGLYRHGDALLAVQNGIAPHRLSRYTLDADATRIAARR